MKRGLISTLLFLILFSTGVTCLSQPPKKFIAFSRLPLLVQEAYNKKFPTGPKAIWRNMVQDEFEAQVQIEGITNWITYDEFGIVIVTKKAVKLTELPEPAKQVIEAESQKNAKINSLKKIEHTSSELYYEAELQNEKEKFLLSVDEKGKVKSTTVLKETE